MTDTYTNRVLNDWTITKIEHYDNGGAITGHEGYTTGVSSLLLSMIAVGDTIQLETVGSFFGTRGGWRVAGKWIERKSDQQLDQDRADMIADSERRDRESLDANREQWTIRTAELPAWVQDRIVTFQERGGEKFELEGWGYELCVAELAVMYAADNFEDIERIDAYARDHGTSGNQHDCAKALARAHLAGSSIGGTVSALSPITGDAFYDKSATS